MAMAQKVKEAEITEQESLLLTRNLLRIAIYNITYIRGLFPEKYFTDKSVPALEMKIKKLMPLDAESRRLIDWMEKGVYDALQKKYLRTLLFCICKELEGPMIEEYAFSFSYSNSNTEVSMNVNRIGNKKKGVTVKSNPVDITPDQMRSSACKMVRTLVQLMRTLDQMPGERTILMKLVYYEDVTPVDYEPPFFRCCSESEAPSTWTVDPLKMEVGTVNSEHIVLALKVKSVLDPCKDENDDAAEDDMSLGGDSVQDGSSSSDSPVHPSVADQFVMSPIANAAEKPSTEDNGMIADAGPQDAEHDEIQIARVKEWIASRHICTVDLAGILSNFPDISVALIEDIMERLVKEGLLSKVGKDSYSTNKEKGCGMEQDVEMQHVSTPEKTNENADEDYLYMKALYHALPMDYVTITKLQNKLDGEANQNTVRKFIDRMAHDGYLKNSGNKRLGKRVVHSELTNRKLIEVKRMIEGQPMETENRGQQLFDFIPDDFPPSENNVNGSTCAGLHSIGSDMTRTRVQSEAYQNAQEQGNTPTSKADLIASLESGVGKDAKGRAAVGGDGPHSTQDKRSRKSSLVEEPILQSVKRQKRQA